MGFYFLECASWSPWTKGDEEILEKVQRRAVAMVSNFKAKVYESKLVEAWMITLEQRREKGGPHHNVQNHDRER